MRTKRWAWLGGMGHEPFANVVRHVLRHLGVHVGAGLLRESPPDVVLVTVEPGHVALRLAVARERARGAPVVALLPSADTALAEHALAAGAHAVHALDTSPAYLRETLRLLLDLTAAQERRPTRRPGRGRRREPATRRPGGGRFGMALGGSARRGTPVSIWTERGSQ